MGVSRPAGNTSVRSPLDHDPGALRALRVRAGTRLRELAARVTVGNVFAAFPELVVQLGVTPRHLVHVGAHKGQEMPWYRAAGVARITLVEPIPRLAARLRRKHADAEVVECACGERPSHAVLHVMRRTNCSTLAAPGPEDRVTGELRVEVRRLADVAPDANIAVVDAQGLELAVLRGANLANLDLAIVETSTVQDSTMAVGYDEAVAFMAGHGFRPYGHWTRDYDVVHRWARGTRARVVGEIRDVIFTRADTR